MPSLFLLFSPEVFKFTVYFVSLKTMGGVRSGWAGDDHPEPRQAKSQPKQQLLFLYIPFQTLFAGSTALPIFNS